MKTFAVFIVALCLAVAVHGALPSIYMFFHQASCWCACSRINVARRLALPHASLDDLLRVAAVQAMCATTIATT